MTRPEHEETDPLVTGSRGPDGVGSAQALLGLGIDALRGLSARLYRVPGRLVKLPVTGIGLALAGVVEAGQRYEELRRAVRTLGRGLTGQPGEPAGEPPAADWDEEAIAREARDIARQARAVAAGRRAADGTRRRSVTRATDQPSADRPSTDQPAVTPQETAPPDELPLPDFDHLTLGTLRARLPRLALPQLRQLLEHERAHAARLPVLTMIENRIAKVQAEPRTAYPADGPARTDGLGSRTHP